LPPAIDNFSAVVGAYLLKLHSHDPTSSYKLEGFEHDGEKNAGQPRVGIS